MNAFSTQRNVLQQRHMSSPEIFVSFDWKKGKSDSVQPKKKVYKNFVKLVKNCKWNHKKEPVIPMVHCTTEANVTKICQLGFGNVARVELGIYGNGMYFTSDVGYAATNPKLGTTKPHAIVAYVLPGNPYPVTEDPSQQNSLLGKNLKTPQYQSHYALVDSAGARRGLPIAANSKAVADEIVIAQEAQIVPAYVVELDLAKPAWG